ncbi:MAG: 3-hydroxyacyl-CoA dehydrogenase family protein [candidate division NC10 bacterium]|nr:3-hydroxyacyl-CoA dehydrogenase family protein [candidate division NC10 bacterium]
MLRIEQIRNVAIIGAGVMGSGIAQTFAQAGYAVRLQARHADSLRAARDRIARNQAAMVRAGLFSGEAARDALARIHPTTSLEEATAGCHFVSESVPEDLDLKREVFAVLDRHAPPGVVLSTDTSGLPISAIASATTRPDLVVGFHWMNPPHLMPTVEVIRGARTADTSMDLTCELARRIGRVPIRVEKDAPGFLWNRLQLALIREALHVVEQGIASPEAVDLAVTAGLGLRWAAVGPLRLMDLGGLTTFHSVAAYLYRDLSKASEPQHTLAAKVVAGETGARAGRGFYDYPAGSAEAAIAARDARLFELLKLLRLPQFRDKDTASPETGAAAGG